MNACYISATQYENVMSKKQKYAISNLGPVDKRFLKKYAKDTKDTLKLCMKEDKKKCKTCINYDKKDFRSIHNYTHDIREVCLDCGRGFEWKNYKPKET